MKDITHYFQVPDKNATTLSNTPLKSEKPPLQKFKDTAKSTNNKRKTVQSKENGENPAKPLDTDTKENVKEKPSSAKKRKDTNTASKSNNKKPKLDVSATKYEKQCNEETTPVPEKRSRKSNGAIFDEDSSEESFTVKKVRKQYTRKKKLNPESNDSIVLENGGEKTSNYIKLINTNVEVCILLEDCMKTNGNELNSSANTESSLSKLEESDSESCFVVEKKTKRTKSKSNEKPEEEVPSGNNLFNYFSKVDKSRYKIQNKPVPNVITVQAIVHSPPKDKSKLIKEKNSNSQFSVVNVKNGKVKKKSCNFDDIKVIETEIIPTKEIIKTVNDKSETACSESQADEISSRNSLLKVQPWKMRVKLNPSSKFDDIKNTKSKKYKKIIWDSDSDAEIESKPKIENDDDVEIVSITKAAPIETEEFKPVKLAPLFCKKRENIKTIDYRFRVSDEAKRLFLESGLPAAMRKKMEEQKNTTEEEYRGEYVYPTSNHVQQKDPTSFVWNLDEFSGFNMKSSDDVISIEEIFSQWWSPLNNENSENEPDKPKIEFDLKNEIALLKKQEPSVNVGDVYNSIKKLHKANEDASNLCWAEKYNPLNFEDMIGNTNSLYKLKEWIENHKNIKQIFLDDDQSSGGEFIDSDDSCNSADVKNNVAILVGPSGCGKTCAVYMLANELGFKVLEVNAGSNRAGKRIMDELLEATQSHRVKRTLDPENFSEPKKIKKKRKNKENKRERKTMSLILIEDADILFENYDEGFLSALNSLASLSKRPLIFTANNLNYPHLQKYNNSQNLILKFDYPSRSSINVWLKLIALTEGVKLTDEVLMELYKVAGSDLRKNLLQLQMLISSKIYSPISNKEQLFHQDWLSHVTLLSDKKSKPKSNREVESNSCDKLFSDEEDSPEEEVIVINEEIKSKSKEERVEDVKALLKSAKFLQCVANLDNFSIKNKQKIFPAEVMYQFDRHENHNTYQLSNDLREFLEEKLYPQFGDAIAQFSFKKYYNAVMQNTKISTTTENVFMYFNPRIGNHVAKNCDYLPTIRNIARSERCKVSSSMRRTTRYFSYLKSVNIDITDKETEILRSTFV